MHVLNFEQPSQIFVRLLSFSPQGWTPKAAGFETSSLSIGVVVDLPLPGPEPRDS
jgi:hypothetical protein